MTSPERGGCVVTWWGHAAATVVLDGVHVVTDPLLRRRVGPLRNAGWQPPDAVLDEVDLVLLSHLHRDHTDLPSLARFGARTRVVVPAGAGGLVRSRVRGRVDELPVGGTLDVGPLRVHAIAAVHDGRRGLGGPTAPALGYLVSGQTSVYVAGDTDLFPQMRTIPAQSPTGRIELALLPVGGWGLTLGPGHLDPARAARALELLRPRLAVPVHWGTLRIPLVWRLRPDRYLAPGPAFAAHAARSAPDTCVAVLRPGESRRVADLKEESS